MTIFLRRTRFLFFRSKEPVSTGDGGVYTLDNTRDLFPDRELRQVRSVTFPDDNTAEVRLSLDDRPATLLNTYHGERINHADLTVRRGNMPASEIHNLFYKESFHWREGKPR